MKKTPLTQVKERFESKEKLVEAVKTLATDELWIDRVSEVKGLEKVPNAKLLRLHAILSEVKEKFGSRTKLIETILDLEKRGKDNGLESRLEAYPTPRLLDLWQSTARRAKRAAKPKAAAAPKNKLPRSKKAQAKAKTGAPRPARASA